MGIGHIAVSDYRDVNGPLHCSYNGPVCLAGIVLLTGSSVNCNGSSACGTDGMSHFNSIYTVRIPACANFYRYRLGCVLYSSSDNIMSKVRIFHKCRPFTILYYFRHRAAHIYIKNHIAASVKLTSRRRHDFRLVAEELICYRALPFKNLQEFPRVFILIPQSLGAHHFRVDKGCSGLSAEPAERSVGYAGKGCQQKGAREPHISDFEIVIFAFHHLAVSSSLLRARAMVSPGITRFPVISAPRISFIFLRRY